MKYTIQIIALLFSLVLLSCGNDAEKLIDPNDVTPWCIIGFDSEERTPQQRIDLLKELGLNKYGFNRGKADFSKMIEEFKLAAENQIEITSVFLWLNAKRDSVGKLSPANEELLSNLTKIDQKPDIWLSFSNNYFENIDQAESIKVSTDFVSYVKTRADQLGCKLALYNHTGWFGDPNNQVEVLKNLNDESVSLVYNFHHAHEHIDQFAEIAKKITPYLSYVNLNGVKKGGPKILTIGEGDHELDMIKLLKDQGYNGPWGILGHIKEEDVEVVLRRNLKGLEILNSKN